MKIEYVNWGIANNFGDLIELHKDLKKYPKLHQAVLSHELRHTEGYSYQDIKNDFLKESGIDIGDLLKFAITRPKTWVQLLPLYYSTIKKEWSLDINYLIFYAFIAIFFGAGFALLKIFGLN